MNYPLLNAMALNLQTGEILVIRFATKPEDKEPEFSGELRISADFRFLPVSRQKDIQRTLAQVSPFVTTYYIQ